MKKICVLLVEDHPVAQEIEASVLKSLGCHVDTADDGQTALTKIRNTIYDLIFMDVVLLGMDGNEVTREIRKYEHSSSRHTPIVALTTNDSEEEKNKSLEAGMDDYCTKPLTPEVAQAVLEQYIKR
jgi:CheY-like chemotaxis protein